MPRVSPLDGAGVAHAGFFIHAVISVVEHNTVKHGANQGNECVI